jgi:hypothetical protein
MAIDSEVKRKSIAAIGHRHSGPVILPSGSFDQADRQAIGYSYSGIAAGAPVIPEKFDVTITDAVVWTATLTDAAVWSVTLTDAVVWTTTLTDEQYDG